jgi:vancomycin permeability regulator SanA
MKGKRWRWVVVAVVALLVLDLGCVIWTRVASAGHIHAVGNAPKAGTVIVFGAQLADNRTEPRPVLRNRLDTALQLYAAGKAEQILVSICRSVGVDADGVLAGCADCDGFKLVWNTVRDWLAAPKAVAEVVLGGGGM